jgi:dsDNA-binding SOS-regulon protein
MTEKDQDKTIASLRQKNIDLTNRVKTLQKDADEYTKTIELKQELIRFLGTKCVLFADNWSELYSRFKDVNKDNVHLKRENIKLQGVVASLQQRLNESQHASDESSSATTAPEVKQTPKNHHYNLRSSKRQRITVIT